MMTVGDLIAKLHEYPEHFNVVMSKDEEGNSFRALHEIQHGVWSAWSGESDYGDFAVRIRDGDNTERELALGESDTICLWP